MTAFPDGLRVARPDDRPAVRALCAATLTADERPGDVPALFCGRPAGAGGRVGPARGRGGGRSGPYTSRRRPDRATWTGHLDLVAVVQTWVTGRGATALWWGDAPVYAWPGIDADYSAALAFATATGAQPASEAINCTVDLATAGLATEADERRLAADGILLERLAPPDLDRLLAWADNFGGRWSAEATAAARREPSGCHAARRGESYVGFAANGSNRSDWFGPMGTAGAERGRGIGAVLLRRCLADQRAAGLLLAQIAWVGPVDFYARTVGARVGRRFTLCRQELDERS